MEHVTFPPLSRVAICGGTHGNEMSGVYMIREMQKQKLDQVGSLSLTTVLSNPRAVDICKRYVDTDLNRCFTDALLSAPTTDSTPYELRRAKELNAQLGPKGSPEAVDLLCDIHNTTSNMGMCLLFYTRDYLTMHIFKYIQLRRAKELNAQLGPKGSPEAVDLLCDIHNTTSNMGMCLLFYTRDYLTMHIFKYIQLRRAKELNAQLGPKGSPEAVDLLCDIHNTTSNMGMCLLFYTRDYLTMHIFKYIQSKMTSAPVRAIQLDMPLSEAYSLESMGKHGITIEVGPQPNGVLRADIYNVVKEALDLTLEWLQKFNSGSTFEGGEVEAYTRVGSVDYPRDPTTNEIIAAVHPQLQDNDFKLLQPGDPLFLSFSGETVKHEGEALYPFFVNECAYYEKKIAFHLAKKVTLTFPSISVKKD